ncbi:uncharacterized protein [Miscanthus floridulus]|uniref:uncharacterized protein n=1 Tax=Miscanthus floridulus TaxID=154761 RepID=UPI00345A7D5D
MLRSAHPNPTTWRSIGGAYFVPQEIQQLNEWRSVVGESCQPQYQALQPLNHILDPMLMHSAMNGYYGTMFTQQPIGTSGGSIQELLRTVCMPRTNYQQCPKKDKNSNPSLKTIEIINEVHDNGQCNSYKSVHDDTEEGNSIEDDE